METLSELVAIVLPVYLCASIGYLWVRSGRSFDTEFATDLIMTIGGPCLVFSSLIHHSIGLEVMLEMFGATILATAVMGGLGLGVLKALKVPVRTFVAPVTFGNTGNMGRIGEIGNNREISAVVFHTKIVPF